MGGGKLSETVSGSLFGAEVVDFTVCSPQGFQLCARTWDRFNALGNTLFPQLNNNNKSYLIKG